MPLTKRHGIYETSRIVYINVNDIWPNPSQPRTQFDKESIREMAASIMRYGILQPLTVHRVGQRYELVAGERRLRAAKLAGLDNVPCIILDINASESAAIALVENLHRHDLDFIEEAEGISKLIRTCNLSQEEAARQIGKTQSAVANKLRILKLPSEILYIIREYGLTERHARALLRLDNNEDRVSALQEIISKNLNVLKTEDLIEKMINKLNAPDAPKPLTPPIYVLKDVRLFLNTVSRGMSMMKQSGIEAEYGKSETDTDILLTIRIPKLAK